MIRLAGGAHTDVGQVRSNNQDAALSAPQSVVYAVADGMGGHRGGEVASALALEALSGELRRTATGVDSVEALVAAVSGANERVLDEARSNAELFGMGTTLCAVALVGPPGAEQVAVVNVGDSRVYVLQDGEMQQLTEDHSLVQSLVRDGQLTADEAAVHPQRNILTRVVGVEPDVEVDWWQRPAVVGERYLLCSDGLFNEVSDSRIAATLRQLADPTEAAKALVALANAGGGRDNVTCVVVDVLDDAGGPGRGTGDGVEGLGATAAAQLAEDLTERPPPPADPPRRFTLRVLAFVVVLVAIGGAAWIAIRTWARHNYFVAADGEDVVIYRGRPDGVLWFDPEVVEQTGIDLAVLTPAQRERVTEGYTTSSRDDAVAWVTQLTTPTTRPPSVPTTTVATIAPPTTAAPTTAPATTTIPGEPPATAPVDPAAPAAPAGEAPADTTPATVPVG